MVRNEPVYRFRKDVLYLLERDIFQKGVPWLFVKSYQILPVLELALPYLPLKIRQHALKVNSPLVQNHIAKIIMFGINLPEVEFENGERRLYLFLELVEHSFSRLDVLLYFLDCLLQN